MTGRFILCGKSDELLGIVGYGELLHVAHGPAGDHHLGLLVADLDGQHVVLDADDGRVNAADGADAVANLEVVEHRLGFLVLLALRTDQQEVEHDEDQDHRHKLHGIVDDGRAGAHGLGRGGRVGRRGGGGGVSQQVHKGILHGERHILSFIG